MERILVEKRGIDEGSPKILVFIHNPVYYSRVTEEVTGRVGSQSGAQACDRDKSPVPKPGQPQRYLTPHSSLCCA